MNQKKYPYVKQEGGDDINPI